MLRSAPSNALARSSKDSPVFVAPASLSAVSTTVVTSSSLCMQAAMDQAKSALKCGEDFCHRQVSGALLCAFRLPAFLNSHLSDKVLLVMQLSDSHHFVHAHRRSGQSHSWACCCPVALLDLCTHPPYAADKTSYCIFPVCHYKQSREDSRERTAG